MDASIDVGVLFLLLACLFADNDQWKAIRDGQMGVTDELPSKMFTLYLLLSKVGNVLREKVLR